VGTVEKPQTPPRPRPQAEPATKTAAPPPAALDVEQGLRDAAKNVLRDAAFGKRPYLKMAFANPYNLSLLVGGLTASALTLNPFLAVATLAVEGLWLLHAPDSARLRHVLWDPRFAKLKNAMEAAERAERMKTLQPDARARVETLVARREEIRRLAAQNPSFAGDLLRNELVKTDRLVDAFLEMSLTCARYEAYLDSVDSAQLDRDRRRYDQISKTLPGDDPQAQIGQKNLAIVLKRIDKMKEIQRYLQVARGQLDLIENSFQLIADQIVTMQSPQELSGQLDELLDGVEAIRQTTRDTEQLIGALEREA